MSHLKITDGNIQYPYYDWSIDYPEISFPSPREGIDFPEQGIFWVTLTQPPEAEGGFHYEEDTPVLDDGVWTQSWKKEPNPVGSDPSLPDVYNRYYGNNKLDLFTFEEQLAVVTATLTDPIVKLTYDRLIGSAYFTYEDPQARQGLDLLVTKGLLTEERLTEIVKTMTNGHIDLSLKNKIE